jgi:GNAT superfamily N-acetyltransferase
MARALPLRFFQSRNLKDYDVLLDALTPDFGGAFHESVAKWCETPPARTKKFWQLWLVMHEENIEGVCGLFAHEAGTTEELWLGWFAIVPERRGRGLGAVTLAWLEKQATDAGCRALYSYVYAEGRPMEFYGRAGYTRISTVKEYLEAHPHIGREHFENDNDHVIRKTLA